MSDLVGQGLGLEGGVWACVQCRKGALKNGRIYLSGLENTMKHDVNT